MFYSKTGLNCTRPTAVIEGLYDVGT